MAIISLWCLFFAVLWMKDEWTALLAMIMSLCFLWLCPLSQQCMEVQFYRVYPLCGRLSKDLLLVTNNTCLNFWRVVPNITSYQNLFPEVKVGSTCMGEAYGFFHSISKRSVHYFSDWLNSFLSQRIEGKKSAVSFQGFSPYVWYGSFSWTCWGFSVNKSIYHAFFREFQKKKKSRVGNFTLACLIKKTKSSNFCSWAPCLAFTTHKYQRRCWYCSLPMTWFWV